MTGHLSYATANERAADLRRSAEGRRSAEPSSFPGFKAREAWAGLRPLTQVLSRALLCGQRKKAVTPAQRAVGVISAKRVR